MRRSIVNALLILIFCVYPATNIFVCIAMGDSAENLQNEERQTKIRQNRLKIITHGKGQKRFYRFIEKHIKEFSFRHPDVEVLYLDGKELELGANFDKSRLAEYYVQMIRSGDYHWDVLWMDPPIYSRVARQLNDFKWGKKHLVDFATVEGFNQKMKSAIIDDPIYRQGTGGIFLGPFLEGYVGVAWYNQKLAQKLGLAIKQHGMSFADLLAYAQAIYRYNSKHDEKIALFSDAATDKRVTLEYMFQNLVKSEISDFDEVRTEVLTQKKLAALFKTFQALEKLAEYHPLLENRQGMSMYDAMWAVIEDKALFHMFGPWNYQFWTDSYSDEQIENMIPAELPVFKEVDFYLGGFLSSGAVFKKAPNKKLAVDFLMSFTTPKAIENYVCIAKTPTGIRGNLTTFKDLETDKIVHFFIEVDRRYRGRVHKAFNSGYLLGAENKHLGIELDKRIHYILEGKISAKQAYDQIFAKLKLPAPE